MWKGRNSERGEGRRCGGGMVLLVRCCKFAMAEDEVEAIKKPTKH